MADVDKSIKTWFPLESNPEVMTEYCARMGLDPNEYSFYDVLSTEDWALEMIPTPVLGVLMLFPIKPVSEDHRLSEKAKIECEGQIVSENLFYMTQTVGNACGTVGLLHCLMNARSHLTLPPGCYLDTFEKKTAELTVEERAKFLEEDDEIEATHSAVADLGQSEQIPIDEDVNSHFVCFTHCDGHLYELDGRKGRPINHGATSQGTFLADACRVVKEFMSRDPEETRFTIVAFAKSTAADE